MVERHHTGVAYPAAPTCRGPVRLRALVCGGGFLLLPAARLLGLDF